MNRKERQRLKFEAKKKAIIANRVAKLLLGKSKSKKIEWLMPKSMSKEFFDKTELDLYDRILGKQEKI